MIPNSKDNHFWKWHFNPLGWFIFYFVIFFLVFLIKNSKNFSFKSILFSGFTGVVEVKGFYNTTGYDENSTTKMFRLHELFFSL